MQKSEQRTIQTQVIKKVTPGTITVQIERKQPHPLYSKIVKVHKNYLVHCDADLYEKVKVGDVVTIGETRPISKRKSWKLLEIIDVHANK